jgi:hypothetical protein
MRSALASTGGEQVTLYARFCQVVVVPNWSPHPHST